MTATNGEIVITRNEIINCINNHIEDNKKIVSKLNDILKEFRGFNKKRLVGKSGGAVASIIGTAGICAAPFTGGASLALTGGIAATVVGIGANITTDAFNFKNSKKAIEKIKELASSRKNYVSEVAKINEKLIQYANTIFNQNEVTMDEAKGKAFYDHMRGQITFIPRSCNKCIVSEIKQMDISEPSNPTKKGLALEVCLAGGEGLAKGLIFKGARELTLTAQSANLATKAVTYASGAAIVFTAIDVGLLVNDWLTENPTIEKIEQFKEKLEEEIIREERNIEIIKRLASEWKTILAEKRIEALENNIIRNRQEFQQSINELTTQNNNLLNQLARLLEKIEDLHNIQSTNQNS